MREYRISRELLAEVIEVLRCYWFTYDSEGESYNNDDVIEVTRKLEEVIQEQRGERYLKGEG